MHNNEPPLTHRDIKVKPFSSLLYAVYMGWLVSIADHSSLLFTV